MTPSFGFPKTAGSISVGGQATGKWQHGAEQTGFGLDLTRRAPIRGTNLRATRIPLKVNALLSIEAAFRNRRPLVGKASGTQMVLAYRYYPRDEFYLIGLMPLMVRPERFELPAPCFVGQVSWGISLILQHGWQPKMTFRHPQNGQVVPKWYSHPDHLRKVLIRHA